MPFFSRKSKSSKSKEISSESKSFTITKNGGTEVTTSITTMTRQSSSSSHSSEVVIDSKLNSPSLGLNNMQAKDTIFDFPSTSRMSTDAKPFNSYPTYRSQPYRSASSATYQPLTTRQNTLPSINNNNRNWPPPIRNLNVSNIAPRPGINDLNCKFEIAVRQSSRFYDDENESKVPVYKTRSKNRGKLLLINNVKFINDRHEREGAELDDANLTKLFQQIGFDVTNYKNLTKTDMEKKIKNFRDSSSLKKVDIGCVIVMSHGTGHERSDSTQVLCSDLQLLETTWIIDQFSSTLCKNLSGKPKIFIFQCCRGTAQDVQYDAIPLSIDQRSLSDMLLAYSTVPGFVSHRDPLNGTLYIQAICKVFMEHAHDTHVEDLLKIVDNKLESYAATGLKQTPSFENRGFKTCYFHPKLNE